MNTTTFAKLSLEQTFGVLNTMFNDMTEEQYNFDPPGTANAAGKTHVHIVSTADYFINAVVAGGTPAWTAFAQAHNLPANSLEIWRHAGAIPLAPMRDFTKTVTSTALETVANLTDDDFDRDVEALVLGKQSIGFFVRLALLHSTGHAGDIASVQGIQGLKGLPF